MDATSAWDRFWHFDRLSSFMSGPGAPNYAAPIASGWHDFFAALPDGARVLDLCTGNGAIAVMAAQANSRFAITGVDLASVEPTAFVSSNLAELRRIKFLPNMAAEALDLPAASFDAVVSQYGVEYSDLDQSVPEAVRVLAAGGKLRFAVHAAEGAVAADTRRAIGEADFLLDEVDLPGRAIRALEDLEGADGAFLDGLKAAEERMPNAVDVAMLSTVHRLLKQNWQDRHSTSASTLIGWAHALRDDIAAHRERQRALLSSSRSMEQMATLADGLAQLGLIEVELGEQRDGGDLIGHTIAARRPD